MSNRNIILIVIFILLCGGIVWYFIANQSENSNDKNITYRHEDGPEDCSVDSSPVFTNDITDLSRITRIIPPAGVQERGELKTHSYLHNTIGTSVPVYAPTDGVIAWGNHVIQQNERGEFDIDLGDEYSLFIELDCNHYIFFDHITNPSDIIKASLQADPAHGTNIQFLNPPISVKAGELLGETRGTYPGGIWDFGAYDRGKKNIFPSSVREVHQRDEQGVCPYDFFEDDKGESYRQLYDKNYANYERVLELCL